MGDDGDPPAGAANVTKNKLLLEESRRRSHSQSDINQNSSKMRSM